MKKFLSPKELGARPLAVKKEQIENLSNKYYTSQKEKLVSQTPEVNPTPQPVLEPVNNNESMFNSYTQAEVKPSQPIVENTPVVDIEKPVVSNDNFQNVAPSVDPEDVATAETINPTVKQVEEPVMQTQPVSQPAQEQVSNQENSYDKIKQAYVVEAGDTVESICNRFGYNVPNFLAYNKLAVTTTITPGMILFFPFNESVLTPVDEAIYRRISDKLLKIASMSKNSSQSTLTSLNDAGELSVSNEENMFN